MRLVRTAVLRGCRRAPHPRHGQRLRVDLIAHSKLADRPGPAGHRRGRRVVCKGSGDCAPLEVNNPHPHQSWNYPSASAAISRESTMVPKAPKQFSGLGRRAETIHTLAGSGTISGHRELDL